MDSESESRGRVPKDVRPVARRALFAAKACFRYPPHRPGPHLLLAGALVSAPCAGAPA